MSKAKYSGSCQCCGRFQKLPDNLLSKHGYTRNFGFFNGVCLGAANLPYEKSCELIKQFIAKAKLQLASLEDERTNLLRPAKTGDKAWVQLYSESLHSYYWSKVEVFVIKEIREKDWSYDQIGHNLPEKLFGKTVQELGTCHDLAKTPDKILTIVTECNKRYVELVVNHKIAEVKFYISWQQQRVKDWKLTELTPVVDDKDIQKKNKALDKKFDNGIKDIKGIANSAIVEE